MISSSSYTHLNHLVNACILMMAQAANLLLPLILMPLLVQRVGLANYGVFSHATALALLSVTICDYGFNLTATKDINNNRDNLNQISKIVSRVIRAKCLLLTLSFAVYLAFIRMSAISEGFFDLYLVTFLMVVGLCFFPVWLYQGLELFKSLALVNIISKSVAVIFVYHSVKGPEDFLLAALIISLSYVFPSILLWLTLPQIKKLRLQLFVSGSVLQDLRDGLPIFLSRSAVYGYTSANMIILAIFVTPIELGYFAIAQRIIGATGSIVNAAVQAVYPSFNQIYSADKTVFYARVKVFMIWSVLSMIFVALALNYWSVPLIKLLAGDDLSVVVSAIDCMLVALVCMPLGTMFTQIFVILGEGGIVLKNTLITAAVNLILFVGFVPFFAVLGAAMTISLTQLFQVFLNYWSYRKVLNREIRCAD